MLGIDGVWVALAYVLSIAATVLCLIYGVVNWNSGAEDAAPSPRDIAWAKEEKSVEETIEP